MSNLYDHCNPVRKRRGGNMLWAKILIVLAVLTLIAVIAGMSYVVKAKYTMNDYVVELGAAFNAATYVNATQTHMEEDKAVIAEYGGQRVLVNPENYKALQSYLRRDYAMPMLSRVNRDEALHVTICGESHLYIVGDEDGQGATLVLESSGESYTMHVTGGDLWQKILDVCMKGFGKNENSPL